MFPVGSPFSPTNHISAPPRLISPIAHIENCYDTKFGVPRQSGIVEVESLVVFEPDYRVAEALRGIEEFDYLWLIWLFSETMRDDWSPTVRPPRLGGNRRIGVFATRSPFRPNSIGLSSVRLIAVEHDPRRGSMLRVAGADLMNGTPILDIKPYLPYTDSHPDARSGFAPQAANHLLQVDCDDTLLHRIDATLRQPLIDILAHDPRPQYHNDPQRTYVMPFAGCEVRFSIDDNHLTVTDISAKQ